ncbi:redoxin domain-containing protein [Bacillus sp. T33-2]|uniref:redoxin domain-containing protein n=1 Tax=Bacillus sp. T33-2 TaxID=2054168 RepID=UPI002155362D|nr:redoxin domain-containing protein [Bacillus sp. T33-2]
MTIVIVQAMGKDDTLVASSNAKLVEIGASAPNFTLSDLSGKAVDLSDYKGRKVMLNFWATWCGPCKAEMPAMQELYTKMNGEIEILAVNMDPKNDVAGYVAEHGLTFPVLLDESEQVSKAYSIFSIPTSFFIDEQGIIRQKHNGSMTLEQMEEYVHKLK